MNQTRGLRGEYEAEASEAAPRHHHHPGIVRVAEGRAERTCKTHNRCSVPLRHTRGYVFGKLPIAPFEQWFAIWDEFVMSDPLGLLKS